MADDIEVKRTRIIEAYPNSSRWKDRVLKMSAPQVVAIHAEFLRKGKIK